MIPHGDVTRDLRLISKSEDFVAESYRLVDKWTAAGAGLDAVESILRFIEEHSAIDYGAPGPLVHFVEDFFGKGYERLLLQSVERKPTLLSVWMLNRVINGMKDPVEKARVVGALTQVKNNPAAVPIVIEQVERFLKRLSAQQ